MREVSPAIIKRLDLKNAVEAEAAAWRNLLPREPWTAKAESKSGYFAKWVTTRLTAGDRNAPGWVVDVRKAHQAFRPVPIIGVAERVAYRAIQIDDQLADATAVLDAFHVVKLATQAVDEVRRRIQQDIHGHRGRKDDPLYRIRNILRSGVENLTDRQQHRLAEAIAADERHDEVHIAWQCAQRVRAVYHADTPAKGRALAETILTSFPSCPIPEIARLGRTLKQWRDAFLGYFTTGGANNGGTEAVNGLIELHRRIARGFRNRENYRLRMLLIAGGLDQPPPQV